MLPRKATGNGGSGGGGGRRFNEAAALLPRKAALESTFTDTPGKIGFNEAAALLPRKALRLSLTQPLKINASMRPRHCCRGRRVLYCATVTRQAAAAVMRPGPRAAAGRP